MAKYWQWLVQVWHSKLLKTPHPHRDILGSKSRLQLKATHAYTSVSLFFFSNALLVLDDDLLIILIHRVFPAFSSPTAYGVGYQPSGVTHHDTFLLSLAQSLLFDETKELSRCLKISLVRQRRIWRRDNIEYHTNLF